MRKPRDRRSLCPGRRLPGFAEQNTTEHLTNSSSGINGLTEELLPAACGKLYLLAKFHCSEHNQLSHSACAPTLSQCSCLPLQGSVDRPHALFSLCNYFSSTAPCLMSVLFSSLNYRTSGLQGNPSDICKKLVAEDQPGWLLLAVEARKLGKSSSESCLQVSG